MDGLFRENSYYVEYETHLRRLNDLMANGLGSTEEAEAIRDCMDTPWYHLTKEESDRLGGLSADLYMLQNDEIFQPSDGRTKIQIGQAVYAAIDQERWAEALDLMRQPNALPREKVAIWRVAAYEALGDLEAALLFLRYAIKLDFGHPVLKAVELSLLYRCNREEEARQKAEAYLNDISVPAFLRINAAGFLALHYLPTKSLRYEDIIPALERALQSEVSISSVRSETMAFGYEVLGFCFFSMGLAQKARDAVREALKLSPSEELTSLLHDLSQATPSEPDTSARYNQILAQQLPSLTRVSDVNKYTAPAYAFAAA